MESGSQECVLTHCRPAQADPQDLEKATELAFKYALESSELLKGEESRQAFKDFLDLVAAAHPINRCPLPLPFSLLIFLQEFSS